MGFRGVMNDNWVNEKYSTAFLVLILTSLCACELDISRIDADQVELTTASAEAVSVDQGGKSPVFIEDVSGVSLNHKNFRDLNSSEYQFLVAGHIYGSPSEGASRPAKTLLSNLSAIHAMDLSMIVLLGDTFSGSKIKDIECVEKAFLNQFEFPIFNAVGNHDVEDISVYQKYFGLTYFSFQYGPALYIFLDTELDSCEIIGNQRVMLDKALDFASQDDTIKHVFIFMHKLLFLGSLDQDDVLYNSDKQHVLPNEKVCYSSEGFTELLEESLLPAAWDKPVYLIAGDVGAWGGNLSPFYEKYPDVQLTTIATGIGDTPQDSMILVSLDGAEVGFKAVTLTGKPMEALESYGLSYWRKIARGTSGN